MLFEGETKIEGKSMGTACIIISSEQLAKYRGGKLKYMLEIAPAEEIEKSAKYHRAKYLGWNGKQHLFEVVSGSSGDNHLVDLSFGCGCDFSGKRGIASGKLCSHVLKVLNDVVFKRVGW